MLSVYRGSKQFVQKIPEFASFSHALAVFDPAIATEADLKLSSFTMTRHDLDAVGEYLEKVYLILLEYLHIDRNVLLNCAEAAQPKMTAADCELYAAYNLVLTTHYMLLVPRGRLADDGGNSVNGMAYLGLFLTTDEESQRKFLEQGPWKTLESVGRRAAP